jgi:hypothetical protein
MVVEAAVVVEATFPLLGDIRLVPGLEVPLLHRLGAEATDHVVDEPGAQLLPASMIPRRLLSQAVRGGIGRHRSGLPPPPLSSRTTPRYPRSTGDDKRLAKLN